MKQHPQLSEKLQLLYQLKLNPALQTNVELAQALGISKQTISKWTRGTPTSHGNKIPQAKIDGLSALFYVEPLWWPLPLIQFETKVYQRAQERLEERFATPQDISLSFLPITSSEVFGRDSDILFLEQAWQDSAVNVVQLTGFGGIGKSTAVAAWLSVLAKQRYKGSQRVYAWSFYWQGASSDIKSSGDFFIEHALNWFGDPNPIEGTPWAKASRLVRLIRASKTLLILDGLEPMQHRPGPRVGQIDNPAVAMLVKELACENTGLCVITSRLAVADLASFDDGRIRSRSVESLSDAASVELLKSLGVKGSRDDFKTANQMYSGHALSLSLLAGYLAVVHKGDLSKCRELHSLLDDKIYGNHARTLMQAYLDWFAGSMAGELLFLVGMFDRGVSISDLSMLCSANEIAGLTNKLAKASQPDWLYCVKQLTDSRILTKDFRGGQTYLDCHPLVRDFISETLSQKFPQIRQSGHQAIFCQLQENAAVSPESMADLEPLFRAVIHGTQAGLYEDAFALYYQRIKQGQFSIFTEGSHHADQACIRSFFENQSTKNKTFLNHEAEYYLLSCAAVNLTYLGEIEESIGLSKKCISWFLGQEMWLEAVGSAAPLASLLIAAGRLTEAKKLLDSLSSCIAKTGNELIQAMAHSFYAYVSFLNGDWTTAKKLFELSDKVLIQEAPAASVQLPTISSYYCKFLLHSGNSDVALERALKTQHWRESGTWQVAIDTTSLLASDLMVLGLIFLERGDLNKARQYLEQQVELLQSADEWLYLPTGLNARSKYYLKIADFEAALSDLLLASEISIRTGAKFSEWETYLNLCLLYLEQSDVEAARLYYAKATKLNGMSDYKFRDNEVSEIELQLGVHSG
ncbi:MAG: tetratricopeptide (TPR) repeat protein/transcriptional regulator with XRE-family HTH domain [Pseudohongiellaceae bacterium]|jgi:tetratricopeptide (TPR) repeat protein/transcriptional regulator with XRE-family HTH domain